ncbi:MAG: thioredoxin family protein [Victivallales bacterium]|nr:thioredoxin family protein [Victivallales bacterium]
MRKTILLVLVSFFAFAQEVAEWNYGAGWTEIRSDDNETVLEIKKAAFDNNRPILVHISRGNNECNHCKTAWVNALCDGIVSHDEGCEPTDETYGIFPVKAWAAAKRVLPVVVKEEKLRNTFVKSYNAAVANKVSEFPMTALVHVKDTADLTSPSLLADEVDIVAFFNFKYKNTIHGVSVGNPPKFSEFSAIVEASFPNAYWASLDNSTLLNPIPSDGTKTLQNQMFTKDVTELWYSFTVEAGRQVGFGGYYATGDTAPARVGYQLFFGSTLVKSGEGDGLTVLDHGFYLLATEGGLYHLRLYATGIEGDKNRFRLIFHEEDIPEKGDITDPYFSGAYLGKWTMDMDAALAAAKANGKDVVVNVGAVTWCPYCMKMQRYFVETKEFRDWAAENAYLVHVENRRRLTQAYMDGNPYGTSLLCDDSPGGYLERNGLTLEQGAEKLKENTTTILESLLEPVGSMSDAKPICYPTLIYRRGRDGSIVGYFTNNDGAFTPPKGSAYVIVSSKLTGEGEREKFFQFQTVAADEGENLDNYDGETVSDQLNNGVSPIADRVIGGVDERDWYGFKVQSALERWVLTVKGTASEKVKMELIAVADGGLTGELLTSAENDLAKGVELRWIASNKTGQLCRVRVTAPNSKGPVPYQLSWECTEDVKTEVLFESKAIKLKQISTKAIVPIGIRNYDTAGDGMAVKVKLVNEDDDLTVAIAEDFVSWTADERAAGISKNATLTLDNAGLQPWEGVRSFSLQLEVVSGEGVSVGAIGVTQGCVYSLPAFEVDEVDLMNIMEYVKTVVEVPFHNGLAGDVSLKPTDPEEYAQIWMFVPEWMKLTLEQGEGPEGILRIEALPDSKDLGTFSLKLAVKDGEKETLSEGLFVKYAVRNLDDINPFGYSRCFAGYFYEMLQDGQRLVRGRLRLTSDEEGVLSMTYACEYGIGEIISGCWTAVDSATGILTTELENGDQKFVLTVTNEGLVSGTMTSPNGTLSIAGSLAAEPLPLASGYNGFLQDYYVPGGAGGVLMLRAGDESWGWNARMPGFAGGDDVVEWMTTQEAVAAIVYGRDNEKGSTFGAVVELALCPDVLPDDYYEQYMLRTPDGVLACLATEEDVTGFVAFGVEDFEETISDRLGLNVGEFWLSLSSLEGFDMAVPVAVALMEDDAGNITGDTEPYGYVSLTRNAVQGCLTGAVNVFVNDKTGATSIQQALLTLAVVPMEQDCCAWDERPVAAGYYVLPDGKSGFAALYGAHNNYTLPDEASVPVRVSGGIAASDAPEEFTADGWLLAVVGDTVMLWRNDGPRLLPAGDARIYNLGEGDKRTSGALQLTVAGALEFWLNTLEVPWHGGWNILAMPWDLALLTPASMEKLMSLNPMAYENGAMVMAHKVEAGQAFWFHLNDVPVESMRLVYDSVKARSVIVPAEGSEWMFTAEPPDWSSGWYWNGMRFVPVDKPLPKGVGGWFMK